MRESGNPTLITARQTADRELTPAFLGFRLIDVLMPATLLDGKRPLKEIEVSDLQAQDFRDPGSGRNARFVNKEKWILQT